MKGRRGEAGAEAPRLTDTRCGYPLPWAPYPPPLGLRPGLCTPAARAGPLHTQLTGSPPTSALQCGHFPLRLLRAALDELWGGHCSRAPWPRPLSTLRALVVCECCPASSHHLANPLSGCSIRRAKPLLTRLALSVSSPKLQSQLTFRFPAVHREGASCAPSPAQGVHKVLRLSPHNPPTRHLDVCHHWGRCL